MITAETALKIARAYREIDLSNELLAEVRKSQEKFVVPDVRDAFGRQVRGLELGIPNSASSRTMMNVEWALAEPIILAHIANQKSLLIALSALAAKELALPAHAADGEPA